MTTKNQKTFWIGGVVIVLIAAYFLLRPQKPLFVVPPRSMMPATVHPMQVAGLTNVYQLTDRVYSGSTPDSDASFKALAERGIKTIISVEGAKPDVEGAKKYGIRYVHLPIGYSGIAPDQANRIVKAAATLPNPIYAHCKYGLQRGPAGAALVCMALENWNPQQAMAWLSVADTSTNYTGLYGSVAQFRPPTSEVLSNMPAEFPEESEVTGLAREMVKVDGHFKELKLYRLAGYQKPSSNPELNPAEDAAWLQKEFKDLLASPLTKDRNASFRERLDRAVSAAGDFRSSLLATNRDTNALEGDYRLVNASCFYCHQEFRR